MHSFLICTIVIFVCAYAQVSVPPGYKEKYPQYYYSKQARHPRDVTWDKQVGKGKVFGTLGNDDQGLFGKGGYKQEIFNDNRGKLEGQAYGTRVLGADGGTSNLGGRLDWSNKDAKAALDISKQIGGRTSVTATGSGVWNLDKNTRISAGGAISQEVGRGKPDIAVQGQFQHDF
ncbi:gloverin-like [Galleria mellonella]|uniref:Gloverin-like n=1 Tax=Galleria mellonella TaxID=7137 RepID=A0ABM3MMW0_GALME|nr:gloverin-like [Galleria mellonella]XP_052752732.1 gloverin-like [Galleria mellonella]